MFSALLQHRDKKGKPETKIKRAESNSPAFIKVKTQCTLVKGYLALPLNFK